jgi:hypothetical protein
MYLKNYMRLLYNLQKNCSKIHLYKKVFFGQKNMQSFFKVMSLVRLISFAPKYNIYKCAFNLIDLFDITNYLMKIEINYMFNFVSS